MNCVFIYLYENILKTHTMKKVSILFVSALALGMVFTSCNKDEDSSSTPAASLEGKWNFSKDGGIVGGQEVLVDYDGNEAGCTKDYIMINTNGTITSVDYDSFDAPCELFTDSMTWTRSGNIITVTDGVDVYTQEILSLTSTELKVKDAEGYITLFTRG